MTDDKRSVNRDDLVRVMMLLHAVSRRVGGEQDTPLYIALHEEHEDRADQLSRRYDQDDVGEAFLAREFHHALLVLESLAWHDGQVRVEERPPPPTVCATPGCPNLTAWEWCTDCQFKRYFGSSS
ncbi:MAG: hypothetical protein M3P85_02065 [Actinomycetota bacterium]|nr:hypothetical protein [Actinomycetota bacterium]